MIKKGNKNKSLNAFTASLILFVITAGVVQLTRSFTKKPVNNKDIIVTKKDLSANESLSKNDYDSIRQRGEALIKATTSIGDHSTITEIEQHSSQLITLYNNLIQTNREVMSLLSSYNVDSRSYAECIVNEVLLQMKHISKNRGFKKGDGVNMTRIAKLSCIKLLSKDDAVSLPDSF